jgi:hypothetical protein
LAGQVHEAVDEALDLVGGPLDRQAPLTGRVGDVEVPGADELRARAAGGELAEPVRDVLVGRPPPHALTPARDLSQRERPVPSVGCDERDLCHLVVLHREHDVGALDVRSALSGADEWQAEPVGAAASMTLQGAASTEPLLAERN